MVRTTVQNGDHALFVQAQPLVSYHGMQASAPLLNDVAAHYLPLHGLSLQDFFTYYPLLGFIEALYYQAREAVEKMPVESTLHPVWQDYQSLISQLLKEQGLEHPLIDRQLEDIDEYLALIHKLTIHGSGTHAEVVRTAELGMADCRLLHAIVMLMLNQTINMQLFDTLWPLETWGEIDWNVAEGASTVSASGYNIYQMFANLYGEEARRQLQIEQARYWSLFQDRLALIPAEAQQRCLDFHARYQQDRAEFNI